MEVFEIVTYFVLLALLSTAIRVVTTSNVIHAAISLVFTLALTAILFLMLSTEFVALVLVLVYIGAVILLFLFGIMITRAPLGKNAELDNDKNKKLGAAISGAIFLLFSYILINSLLVCSLSVISTNPSLDTVFPGINFNELGLGVN